MGAAAGRPRSMGERSGEEASLRAWPLRLSLRRLCCRGRGGFAGASLVAGSRLELLALWEGGPTKRVGAGRRFGFNVEVWGSLGGVLMVLRGLSALIEDGVLRGSRSEVDDLRAAKGTFHFWNGVEESQ